MRTASTCCYLGLAFVCGLFPGLLFGDEAVVKVATFEVDASPPVGSPLAYDPTIGVEDPLSCRGIVILSNQQPIVLCAVDWIGISNGGQTLFRESLAAAAGTVPERVVVHALHQHDAPRCDFTASEIVATVGLENVGFDARHARSVIAAAAEAIQQALPQAMPVTHVGIGQGLVEQVASNRRIQDADGIVIHTRYTATRDPKIREFPEGTIDPWLKSISFWNHERPLAVLTYYATHPQSYYRTGLANPDFPGMARNARQEKLSVPHIHFNGAGGNIGAGKYNDGAKENRQVLADRVAAGMERAWDATTKYTISATDLAWNTTDVLLPIAEHLREEELLAKINNSELPANDRWYAAKDLAWLRRCRDNDPIQVSGLRLGQAQILHLPGELFVEYQLAAQKLSPQDFVALAAYGDYAPGYIGTEIAYGQGGYETSQRASKVAPQVEQVLMQAMQKLLSRSTD